MVKIAVISQKGGVGKTCTSLATFHGLRLRGARVLGIDCDTQENFTLSLAGMTQGGATLVDVLLYGRPIEEVAVAYEDPDTPMLPAKVVKGSIDLASVDMELDGQDKYFKLKNALAAVEDLYDYVVMDTPPALGTLSINAMIAADVVVTPVLADTYSLHSLRQLAKTFHVLRSKYNNKLSMAGLLLTKYDARAVLTQDMGNAVREAAAAFETTAFTQPIREAVACKEAATMQRALESYAPKAKVTADYRAYIEELLERCGRG